MARNLQLALTLFAKDTASKVLRKAMQDTINQTKAVEKADDQLGKSQKQNAETAIRSSRTLQQEWQRAASARSTLGIRSERDIQREIQLTQAAYNRLTRTGTLSANEQSRAFAAMTERVSKLRGELNGAGQTMSRLERAKGFGSNTMAIAGGITAAGMVIKDPVQRQMSWTQANAKMANTGYNELTPEQRIAKMPAINSSIQKAVREGGGTPEQAQDTLDSIFSAGQVDSETAMKILPTVMKYATGSGADPKDLAKMASSGIANFGIKVEDLPEFFDKSVRSGENGSFELVDQAQYMPKILASGKKVGMSGLRDYEKLLALLQANKLSTGDSSQAATNVDNLLNKYVSADTQNALKNYRFKGKNGKVMSYADYMADQRTQGVGAGDAFTKAVGGIVSADPRVKKLRAESQKYQGTDKGSDINAALNIIVSSITSKIVADAQAGSALATTILQRDYIKNQEQGTANSTGAGDSSFKVIASTPGFKSEQLESEKFFANLNAMEPLSNIYGDLATRLTEYSKEYPELTIAISGATTGIKAMGAAAFAFAGLKFLSGGAAGAAGAGGIGGAAGRILGGGGGIMLPTLAITASSVAISTTRDILREDFAKKTMPEKVNAISAGTSGYSFVDVAWEVLKSRISGDSSSIKKPSDITANYSDPLPMGKDGAAGFGVPSYLKPQTPAAAPIPPIHINTKLELDGKVVAESTNEVNANQASRGSTGGY